MSSESSEAVVTTAPSPSSASVGHAPATSLASAAEWRSYTTYEHPHPITAATTAMLNINGATDDPNSGFGPILYDYYGKMQNSQDIIKTEKTLTADIWSPVAVTSANKLTNGDLANEIFVTSGGLQGNKLQQNSVLRRGESKLTSKITQNGHRYTNGDSLSPADPNGPPPSSGGVIIIKEENAHSPGGAGSPRMNGILGVSGGPGGPGTPNASVSPSEDHPYQSPQLFATLSNPSSHASPYEPYGTQPGVVVSSPSQFTTSLRTGGSITLSGAAGIYTVTSPNEPYFRDYYSDYGASGVSSNTRQLSGYDGGNDTASFVDRYSRAAVGPYKTPVTIDLPSPDSGIGTDAVTPRDHSTIQQGFDYTLDCHPGLICGDSSSGTNGRTTPSSQPKSTRPWHDFGRQSEADKIQIPKLFSNYGFRYYLESPISTSQRREDDRITYINKGQFYGITLEYIPESDKPLKSHTVKTVVMLVFREEKSPEDEIKAWQFWHGRQHSVKQRILDADTKNSVGLAGSIDEIAHNAIAIYWNPLESSAKINVAVQCLSTDFSSQKGVKGLPLHLQIDTYDDPRDPNCPIFHRAYCQIKVFCDKGAERKTRDEERRAAKRKLTATGRKKLDEMYHSQCDRSEFYSMSDLGKPPVLFTPAEDLDKLTSLELGFYNTNSEGSEHSGTADLHNSSSNNVTGSVSVLPVSPQSCGSGSNGSNTPTHSMSLPNHHNPHNNHNSNNNSNSNHNNNLSPHHHQQQHPHQHQQPSHHNPPAVLKFHNTFPPESPPFSRSNGCHPPSPTHSSTNSSSVMPVTVINEKKDVGVVVGHVGVLEPNGVSNDSVFNSPSIKRMRLLPPSSERLMLFVRQEPEEAFTPLHLVPPTTLGLLSALEDKYKISMGSVKNLYRRNSKGLVAKIDDEMLKHYCHEDSFLLELKPSENEDAYDVTLAEFLDLHQT